VTAQRQHELEVAAVARDVTVELAFVANPDVDRADLSTNTESGEERAFLL